MNRGGVLVPSGDWRVARPRRRFALGLWLPLTPIFVLLAPFALLAAPVAWLTPAGRRVRPVRGAWAMGGLLLALSGTSVSVETPAVRIRIRIF